MLMQSVADTHFRHSCKLYPLFYLNPNRDTLAVRRRNMLPLDSTVIIIKNIGSNIIRNTTFFFTVVLDNTWGCLC